MTSRILAIPIVLTALVTPGCTLSIETFCAQRAAIVCDRLYECSDPDDLQYEDERECRTELESAYLFGWEYTAEYCTYVPDDAATCLHDLEELECDWVHPEYLPESCGTLWDCS